MRNILCLFLIAFWVCSPACARAQSNYEIQVYGSELVQKDHTMFELHSNYGIEGFTQTKQINVKLG